MSSFGQTLKHVRHPDLHLDPKHPFNPLVDIITVHFCCFQGQRQIEQAVQRVDMDKDIKALVEENNTTTENHKAEFLMADYFVSLPFICPENLDISLSASHRLAHSDILSQAADRKMCFSFCHRSWHQTIFNCALMYINSFLTFSLIHFKPCNCQVVLRSFIHSNLKNKRPRSFGACKHEW